MGVMKVAQKVAGRAYRMVVTLVGWSDSQMVVWLEAKLAVRKADL